MKRILLGSLILITIFSVCVYGVNVSDTSHYDDGEFSFDYPANMTLIHNHMILYLNNFGSFPDKSTPNPPFKNKYMVQMFSIENYYPKIAFTVYKTSSEPGISLNDIISNEYNKTISIDHINYQGNIKLNGISAYEIDSQGFSSGKNSNNEDRAKKEVIFEKNGMVYILYFGLNDHGLNDDNIALFNNYTTEILQNFQVH